MSQIQLLRTAENDAPSVPAGSVGVFAGTDGVFYFKSAGGDVRRLAIGEEELVSCTFDVFNRPTLAVYASGREKTFTYGPSSVVVVDEKTGEPTITWTYTLNEAGLITSTDRVVS